MPGVTHWQVSTLHSSALLCTLLQSPYMHAYFPALNSYPSLLGDMLADGINCLGFTWASSPACTELESLVMDWLGQAIGLPGQFLHKTPGSQVRPGNLGQTCFAQTVNIDCGVKGGGVIQTTASESTFVCLLAGRTEAIKRCQVGRAAIRCTIRCAAM